MRRDDMIPELRDVAVWPSVNIDVLDAVELARFRTREMALRAYLGGASMAYCAREHGVTRQELYRLLARCLAGHPDGRIWGFRALLSQKRVHGYQRRRAVIGSGGQGGASGALMRLFSEYPTIQEHVDALYLRRRKHGAVHEARISLQSIHRQFLQLCRDVGVPDTAWPFTAKQRGRRSLGKYLHALDQRHMAESARARHGDAVARQLGTGDPSTRDPILRPYQRVQFDGHRVNALFTVELPSPLGGTVEQVLERFWLLALYDMATDNILGYAVSLSPEYSADDVLRCMENALTPWKPQILTIPGLRYPEGGGLPSGLFPECAWACWDELSYDNAMANRAHLVRERLTEVVGCAIIAGPPATPARRGELERFFGIFEEHGFNRTPNTTGSNPKDPRRRGPEAAAQRLHISYDHVLQLVDVMVVRWNCAPHEGIGFRTPVEALQHYIEQPNNWLRTLPEHARGRGHLARLTLKRHVSGDPGKSRRPYITYENVRYHNPVLARSPGLIKKELTLTVNPADIRSIRATLPDGSDLGMLTAHGAWGRTPHSLETRKAIYRLRGRRELFWSGTEDPIDVYLKYLATQSQKKKRSRNRLKKTHDTATQTPPDAATVTQGAAVQPAAGSEASPQLPTTILPHAVQPEGLKALVY